MVWASWPAAGGKGRAVAGQGGWAERPSVCVERSRDALAPRGCVSTTLDTNGEGGAPGERVRSIRAARGGAPPHYRRPAALRACHCAAALLLRSIFLAGHAVIDLRVAGFLEFGDGHALHAGIDIDIADAGNGAEFLQHEENHAVMDHADPVAVAH